MAAPKGVLLEGVKKKIMRELSAEGCDIKTTASLCQKFPILFFHESFVNEMARLFKLEKTVKEFSKNRIAVDAPPRSPEQNDEAAEAEALALAETEGSSD